VYHTTIARLLHDWQTKSVCPAADLFDEQNQSSGIENECHAGARPGRCGIRGVQLRSGTDGAVEVAEALRVSPGQVYKTLVMLRDEKSAAGHGVGEREVDLRVLAQQLGSKSVRMAPKSGRTPDRLQTGHRRSGPAGKPFPVYLDRAALGELEIL
jgi:prolyl-tRNA editing enzyme YbaK/EbsC (Cys-tRNA(Pro) deacylase)